MRTKRSRFGMLTAIMAICLTVAILGFGQTIKEKDEIIRVDTQLVDVPVAVTSSNGIRIRDLKASNFVVYEDGKLQKIENFSAAAAPFEVALVLDTSVSTRSDLPLIKRAALEFVQSLRNGDRVSISAFDSDLKDGQTIALSRILAGLTEDRAKLRAAIDSARTSFGTPYYDSLLQVADSIFREPPSREFRGRRAIVALTDGVDSTSLADFEEVKGRLQKLGIVCFFVNVDTRDFFETGLLGDCQSATHFSTAQIRRYYRSISTKANTEKAVTFCQLGEFERLAMSKRLYDIAGNEMFELAKTSGGQVFPVADLNEARKAFKSVADEIGTQFTIGYYPTNEKRDGTFRKIRVETRELPAGTLVRAREGYTAPIN